MAIEKISKKPEPGSTLWYEGMQTCGQELKKNSVANIVFVHGTFTGNDPLGIARFLQRKASMPRLAQRWREGTQQSFDFCANDFANYTTETIATVEKSLEIKCHRFTWSSGNDHLSRLEGVIDLIDLLQKINTISTGRLLLIGHSHAGQLFALLTLFLEGNQHAKNLYEFVRDNTDHNSQKLLKDINQLQDAAFDITTFGTPTRYPWGRHSNYRLLSVINHRSHMRLSGLLSTRDGDYIQQFGGRGSDFRNPVFHSSNRKLNNILDKGNSLKDLWNNINKGHKIKPHYHNGETAGKTRLIDYGDGNQSGFKTVWGHGIYTTKSVQLFNFELILRELFND